MQYTFTSTLIKDDASNLMWNYRIIVPKEIVNKLTRKDKRVICTIHSEKTHSALLSNGVGDHFIMINKEIRKKMALELGDNIEIILEDDESKYGMATTESFIVLCEQDPEGNDFFHKLTKGKQRSLLHIMGKPKSEQKQMEKALIIFDYLKSTGGNLDFKELNENFRNNRFKI